MKNSHIGLQDKILGVAIIGCCIIGVAGVILSLISVLNGEWIASAFFLLAGGLSSGLLVYTLANYGLRREQKAFTNRDTSS